MTDSITQLEEAFQVFDIEGDGKVDYISFATALQTNSAIPLSVDEAKEIFDTLEKDEEERILYSDFIAVCRKQKLGGNGDAGDMATTPSMKNIVGAPVEKITYSDEDKAEIERAKVVIQKAMLKKMDRSQVYEFLKSKGVRKDLIDHAYNEVQANMAPQARIRYYKELSEQNAREASEAAYENKKMKKKVNKIESELIKLRATLSTSVQMVMQSFQQTSKSFCPQEVIDEVKDACDSSSGEKKAQLERLLELLQARRFVVAWLLLQTVEDGSSLSSTDMFLEDFHPN